MTGDRPTTPGWHCHRCRSTSCRQRADSDTDHVGRVEYRPLLLTQPSSVSWLWSHTHWCPSQRPQEVMRVDGSANPTMPKNPAQYGPRLFFSLPLYTSLEGALAVTPLQPGAPVCARRALTEATQRGSGSLCRLRRGGALRRLRRGGAFRRRRPGAVSKPRRRGSGARSIAYPSRGGELLPSEVPHLTEGEGKVRGTSPHTHTAVVGQGPGDPRDSTSRQTGAPRQ